jgi:hypothetical protein
MPIFVRFVRHVQWGELQRRRQRQLEVFLVFTVATLTLQYVPALSKLTIEAH